MSGPGRCGLAIASALDMMFRLKPLSLLSLLTSVMSLACSGSSGDPDLSGADAAPLELDAAPALEREGTVLMSRMNDGAAVNVQGLFARGRYAAIDHNIRRD